MKAPRTAFGEALAEFGAQCPELLVLDADVGSSTMTSLFAKAYPDRFYQVGIAEANMAGIAAGLAATGFTPVLSTFAVFATKRMLDQVSISIAYPGLNVKINGAYSGVPTGRAGATHQAFEDVAVMRALPNMRVLVPADCAETRAALRLALDTPGPVYISTVRCEVPDLFGPDHALEWGKARLMREGGDVALIACGMMTAFALRAADLLEAKGIHARVLNMASIKPLDVEAVCAASRDIGRVVTIENHSIIGGLGSAVAEVLSEQAPCRLLRIGFPDVFGESGDDDAFFAKYGCDSDGIARRTLDFIGVTP